MFIVIGYVLCSHIFFSFSLRLTSYNLPSQLEKSVDIKKLNCCQE